MFPAVSDVSKTLLEPPRVRGVSRNKYSLSSLSLGGYQSANLARGVERSLGVHEQSNDQTVETCDMRLAMF